MKNAFFSALLAEFLGSVFLVMAAVSPMILLANSPPGVALFANAVAVAWVLFALIEIFAPLSGAHFNPVVTVVLGFENKMGATKAAAYIVVQIFGGVVGIIFTHLMFFREVGAVLAVSTNPRQEYFSEILATFILMLAILLLVEMKSTKSALVVGLLVGGQVLATSSTMFANPQVTIARMLTAIQPGIRPLDGLAYIAAQFAGGVLAYGVFRVLRRR